MTPQAWLRENLGKETMGALTGTDTRALNAAKEILELYSYTGSEVLLYAFAKVVCEMQPSTRWFAYHIIAMVMDWDDRKRIWIRAGMEQVQPRRCKHEPNKLVSGPQVAK